MKEKKLVVFDMDGTLNRIELFIIPTYKEVLQKFAGAQADDDTVMRLMGCVDEQIYQDVYKRQVTGPAVSAFHAAAPRWLVSVLWESLQPKACLLYTSGR